MAPISAKALASYMLLLEATDGYSRRTHTPAATREAYFDRFTCPACVGNANEKNFRVVYHDDTWCWMDVPTTSATTGSKPRRLYVSNLDCYVLPEIVAPVSLMDHVRHVEVFDVFEWRVLGVVRDGTYIPRECPICHDAGKQLLHIPLVEAQKKGAAWLLQGYLDIPTMAELLHLPDYQKWLDREKPHVNVSSGIAEWFLEKHLGTVPRVTTEYVQRSDLTGRDRSIEVWYECPECYGESKRCHMCSGTGEVTRSYLLERFDDEFVQAVEEDQTCPYYRAWADTVLDVFNAFVVQGAPWQLQQWSDSTYQLRAADWKEAYRWLSSGGMQSEPPQGTYRQRAMWVLHTDSVVWDRSYARSKFLFAMNAKLESL